jgi:hypothetical protein
MDPLPARSDYRESAGRRLLGGLVGPAGVGGLILVSVAPSIALDANLHQSCWIPPNTASTSASMYASVIRTSGPE